jgi:glycosyltransferase involved in cell wall biosynthesis
MSPPAVSVVLAARDARATIGDAVTSVLAQSLRDLELVVVDDGSVDGTGDVLAAVGDPRLRVVRNDEALGLAGALNVGLGEATGRYVARLDADDLARPEWLERLAARMASGPPAAVVGTGTVDFDDAGCAGRVHRMPAGARAVRWAALFSSPFFHPTVMVDRRVLDEHGLRYDTAFAESEDYDLWARLLAVADGDNLREPLVLYRRHAAQASTRRADIQRDCQRRVALRQIGELAPRLAEQEAELAWLVGSGRELPPGSTGGAIAALEALVEAFERRHGGSEARRAAAWALFTARADDRAALGRAALSFDSLLPLQGVARVRRRRASRAERDAAQAWLRHGLREAPIRVAMVVPEPTPYRNPMLDLLAARDEIELTVLYAGGAVQQREWQHDLRHPAVVLEGRRVPGARRVLRHDYPLSLGAFRALGEARPDVVVVSGWSTFASQAAIAWCRLQRVPYVLLVESNDRDERPGWRRAVKGSVVPAIVRGAAHVLVVGTLARESMLARGADPGRIDVFADTIDVGAFGERADALAPRRLELRAEAGLGPDDVAVLSVARLAPEKGLDTLVRAVAVANDPRLVLLVAGSGPERARLEALARAEGVRLVLLPHVEWDRIVERYAIADVFALLSTHEPWGVVVNEAAASGLPLVLSDRVGAARDLLEDGRSGVLVRAGDAVAAGAALGELARDAEGRRAMGAASRELVQAWGYEPSIETLVRIVRRIAAAPVAAG